ncbi:MAG: nicotinate-nucleotide adenylyltransferase [Pseudomonadales bacterium]|nr:nicotinate-nucleotide adenylyltransferase [Pseudomonadales bacterium]
MSAPDNLVACDKPALVIYGGTFDPVHFGHLRSAMEVGQALGAASVRLLPCYLPAHREATTSTAEQRLAMLRLAVRGVDYLEIDDRELVRKGYSYSVDTLKEIRHEVGPERSVSMVIGADAYMQLNTWHQWQKITQLAHLVVLERPGYAAGLVPPAIIDWVEDKLAVDPLCLAQQAAGLVCHLRLNQFEVSATKIRSIVLQQGTINYLLPSRVIEYINQQGLYQ